MTIRYAHAANFSNIIKCHQNFTQIHIKQNSAYNAKKNTNPANQPTFRPHKEKNMNICQTCTSFPFSKSVYAFGVKNPA